MIVAKTTMPNHNNDNNNGTDNKTSKASNRVFAPISLWVRWHRTVTIHLHPTRSPYQTTMTNNSNRP